jgi:hypothetical protein
VQPLRQTRPAPSASVRLEPASPVQLSAVLTNSAPIRPQVHPILFSRLVCYRRRTAGFPHPRPSTRPAEPGAACREPSHCRRRDRDPPPTGRCLAEFGDVGLAGCWLLAGRRPPALAGRCPGVSACWPAAVPCC